MRFFARQGRVQNDWSAAIAGDATWRNQARTDRNFDNIREDPRFKELIGPDEPEQEEEPPP